MDDSDDDLPNISRLTPPRTRAKTPAEEPRDPGENDEGPDQSNSLPASGHQLRTKTRLSEEESREKEKGKC